MCSDCPAGRASGSVEGRTTCDACTAGRYTPLPGYSECFACLEGTFSLENATSCEECPLGKTAVFESDGAGSCVDLPAGGSCGRHVQSERVLSKRERPSARLAMGEKLECGASACIDCEFIFLLSKHCDSPLMGTLIAFVSILLVGTIVVFLRHRFMKKLKFTQIERDKTQTRLLESKREIMMMASAWKLDWSEIELDRRLAAGGYGEVWSGTLNGAVKVAVKKMFNTSK